MRVGERGRQALVEVLVVGERRAQAREAQRRRGRERAIDEQRGGAGHPHAAHRRSRLEHRPAAQGQRAEEQRERGGAEQVAVDHRGAADALGDEHQHEQRERRQRHRGAPRRQPDGEADPRQRADQHGELVDAHGEGPQRADDANRPLGAPQLLGQPRGFIADGHYLLLQRRLAPLHFRPFFAQPRRQSFRCRQPLVNRRKPGAPGGQLLLLRLHGAAQTHKFLRQPRALRFCFGAIQRRRGMLVPRAFRTLPRSLSFFPHARQLTLANRQLCSQPRQFRLHVAVAVLRGNHFALRVALLRIDFFQRLFRRAQLGGHRLQRRLLLAHLVFELKHFGIQRAQFALHAQWSRFVRAPAGYHAPLVARALRRDERVLRIVLRQLFRGCCAVRQIRRAQPRQELLRRRSQRIAEFYQLVHPRNHAVSRVDVRNRFILVLKPQVAQ